MNRHHRKSIELPLRKIIVFLFLLTFVIASILIYKKSRLTYKLTIAQPGNSDEVTVLVLSNKASLIKIPGDVRIEAGYGLGEWPIKSLWKLGQDEKKPELLSLSLTRSLSIPVGEWSELNLLDSMAGLRIVSFLLGGTNTSLDFVERVFVAGAYLKGDYSNIETIDVRKTGYIDDQLVVSEKMPLPLAKIFSEEWIIVRSTRVSVVNGSTGRAATRVSNLLSTMGAQVVSLEKDEIDGVCSMSGDKDVVLYLTQIMPCEIKTEDTKPFDVVIKLGRDFDKVM